MTNAEIALGTKLFSRETKLHQLLQSVPEGLISTVYVADDGDADYRSVFEKEYPFDLTVIDNNHGVRREEVGDQIDSLIDENDVGEEGSKLFDI